MTAPDPSTLLVRGARYVITRGECTHLRLRRGLHIGEAEAAQLMADLEAWGIVGPPRGAGSRIVRYSPQHLPTIYELIAVHGTVAPDPNPMAEQAQPPLTKRQREVFVLLAEGLTNTKIGQKLYLAEDTVKSHVSAIFRVLDARNRAHAVALGHWHGLLPPTDMRTLDSRGVEHRPIPALTPRQLRLIELVAEGHTIPEIATSPKPTAISGGASESDIKDLLIETREIFGARNKTHLVHLAVQRGVLTKNPEFDGGVAS